MNLSEETTTKYREGIFENNQISEKLEAISEEYRDNKTKNLDLENSVLDQVAQLSLRSIDSPGLSEFLNDLMKQLDELETLFKKQELHYSESFSCLYESTVENLNNLQKQLQEDKKTSEGNDRNLYFFKLIEEKMCKTQSHNENLNMEFLNLVKGEYNHSYYDIEQAKKSILEVQEKVENSKTSK